MEQEMNDWRLICSNEGTVPVCHETDNASLLLGIDPGADPERIGEASGPERLCVPGSCVCLAP